MSGWISAGILCLCGPKLVKGVGANAATVHLSPRLALPASQKTDAHVPGQCGNQGLLNISSTTRAALSQAPHTHTQYSIDSCNSNREYSQSPGFQCLIVAKTERHGFRKLDPLVVQTPFSCEHPFPLLKSTLSNQETRASCVNHSLANVT